MTSWPGAFILWPLLVALLSSAQAVAQEGTSRVAVCPFEGSGIDADRNVRLAVEDQLQTALASRSGLTVLERSGIQHVLAEQSLQASGPIDAATAVHLGQLLQADALVVGACRRSGDAQLITVRLVRTSDAQVLWAAEAEGSLEALIAQCPGLADACAAAVAKPMAVAPSDAAQASLAGTRHHDRAQALRAQGLQADAVSEELLALNSDPGLDGAALGLAQAFADLGLPQLAAAEAQERLARHKPSAPADAAALQTIAALPAPPAVAHAPHPPSALVRGIKAVISRLAALPADDPQVERDLITMHLQLAKQYTAEAHDRAALAAYEEAMARKRALRRQDPSYFADEAWLPIFEDPTPLSLPTCLGEMLAGMRRACISYGNGFDRLSIPAGLPAIVAQARREHVDPSALAPPRVGLLSMALTDAVYLDSPLQRLLVHLPLAEIPAGAAVIGATLDGDPGMGASTRIDELGQAWVAAQATSTCARTGVPWIAFKVFPNNGVNGREIPVRGSFHHLADVIAWEAGHRHDADGVSLDYFRDPRVAGRMQLVVLYALPEHGASAAGPATDACQQVIDGVCALLAGKAAEARSLFAAVKAMPKERYDIGRELLDPLIAACSESP